MRPIIGEGPNSISIVKSEFTDSRAICALNFPKLPVVYSDKYVAKLKRRFGIIKCMKIIARKQLRNKYDEFSSEEQVQILRAYKYLKRVAVLIDLSGL